MKKTLILTVAAAAIIATGCDRQKQATNNQAIESEKENIKQSVREAKSEVDRKANAQKEMLNAEAKAAQASLDAEKARIKAESTPNPQAAVDTAAQNIRDAAGSVGAKVQTEVGTEKNVTTPTVTPSVTTPAPTTPTPATTTSETDQKLIEMVRTVVLGENTEVNAEVAKAIEITATDGAVTLKGSVKSEEEKARMETAAQGVTGVTKVDNQLEVKPQ